MQIPLRFGTCIHAETGLKHFYVGKPCEDSVSRYYSDETGAVAVALSDGGGSYEHAREGSEMIARTAAKLLANKFDKLWELDEDTLGDYIVNAVCHPLKSLAESRDWTMESMYSTLLLAGMHPDGRYICFRSGDGVIVGYAPGKGCELLSRYEHNFASSVVDFVNAPGTEYHVCTGRSRYASFLLTSDGSEPYLIPEGNVTAPVLMLMQAGYVLSEAETVNYMNSLMENTLRNICHADDDLSFALLFDINQTKKVLGDMAEPFFCGLMDIPKMPEGKAKLERYAMIVEELHRYPGGITKAQLGRKMYEHKISILMKKINGMFPGDYIGTDGGRVYLK